MPGAFENYVIRQANIFCVTSNIRCQTDKQKRTVAVLTTFV